MVGGKENRYSQSSRMRRTDILGQRKSELVVVVSGTRSFVGLKGKKTPPDDVFPK